MTPVGTTLHVSVKTLAQRDVDDRRRCYHEALVREAYIKHADWITQLGWPKAEEKRYYTVTTVCEMLRYRRPVVPRCAALRAGARPLVPLAKDDSVFRALARLELVAREPVLSLLRVQHGEIVVRLGKLRVVAQHGLERRDGFVGLAGVGQREPLEEARLRLAGTLRVELVEDLDRFRVLLLGDEGARILQGLRVHLAVRLRELARIGDAVALGERKRRGKRGEQHGDDE